jgi:hypothetical protein
MLRYVVALAESSIVEAWQYQRSFSEKDDMRPRLFRRIVDWAISRESESIPRCEVCSLSWPLAAVRAHALKSFVSLPLSPFEQGLLNDIALKPSEEYDSPSVALIQDLVCVRYIELGKYIDAIKMDRKFAAAGFDQKESSDRKALLRDLHESLSPVEKSLLEAELKLVPKEKAPQPETPARPVRATTAEAANLSQSWEEVPVPQSLNKSTNTPLRNIQIPATPSASAGPQFGTPSAAVPVPSTSITAPLLPLSNGSTSISANGFTPRKSGPLSTLGKGKPSLSGVGQRLAMGAGPVISSPASGMRLPGSANKAANHASSTPAQHVFVSTVNQANAFYQPKQSSQKRPLPSDEEEEEEAIPEPEPLSAVTDESQPDEGMDVDADKEEEKAQESSQDKSPKEPELEVVPGWKDMEPVNQLNRSIFGTSTAQSPSAHISARSSKPNGNASMKKAKMQPPGAFDDEESHHEHTEPEPEPEYKPRAIRKCAPGRVARTQSATNAAHHDASTSPQAKPIRKTRSVKQEKKPLSRSIPGGLMDDEDADHEGEEEGVDKLAPLRGASPPPARAVSAGKTRALRKPSRSIAGSEGGSDGEGLTRTRRSSRLSTTGSVRNLSPEAAKEPAAPKRKSGRAATTKRKKQTI